MYRGQPVEPKPDYVYDAQWSDVPEFDPATGMRNWSIRYVNNDRPGTATAILEGVVGGAYGGSASEEFTIIDAGTSDAPTTVSLSKDDVMLESTSCTYTGNAIEPSVIAMYGARTLTKDEDFTVVYADNELPGTARAVVTGKGPYEGSVTLTFRIDLGKTKFTKIAKGKGAFTAKWKRVKSGGVGYQVRYSPKKNMKGAKTKSVKKNATTKLKVGKLKGGKKYYAQVRTYKKIGKKTYYSAWSAKKTVKVK